MTEEPDALRATFGLAGSVAVVTGGTGALGGAMARGLAGAGARVAVLGRNESRALEVVASIADAGGEAMAVMADVLQRPALEAAREDVAAQWGDVDILINAAGGNVAAATTGPTRATIFDLDTDAFRQAIDLNLLGTVLPCQVFGAAMARHGRGAIVNVSSMSAATALTRVVGYSAGKAAMENFTRWLAVDLARRYGPGVRVNAIAPGFFLAAHNRDLLAGADGVPTARGETILARTPMGRFGEPDDLIGAVVWLCSPGAAFVTGIVVPIDGGFSAFSGV